jgi:hypothetical protein
MQNSLLMNSRMLIAFGALIAFTSTFCCRAETAHATFWCISLRFHQAKANGATLDISSVPGPPFNGELFPYNGDTYAGYFYLTTLQGTINGALYVDLPPFADQDANGFDDFFEIGLPAGGTTSGSFQTAVGNGAITANWNRAAGSKDGTCTMDLNSQGFGDLGQFPLPFEVLSYSGPLTYTPGTNTVTARIDLAQTGNPSSLLGGPLEFVKSATNRFNMLLLQPGVWTNAAAQNLIYTNEVFERDVRWPTNYYGYVDFDDGDPSTPGPDYYTWVLSIDDLNDTNHNGVPDFSDDPTGAPTRPALSLELTITNLLLTVRGELGQTNLLQQTSSLADTNWQTTATLVLTNSPQVVPLGLPASQARFWRLQTQ